MKLSYAAIGALMALQAIPVEASADIAAGRIPVESVSIGRKAGAVTLDMALNTASLRLGRDSEYLVTPVIVSADGRDSVEFAPVLIAGRNFYYLHQRRDDLDGTRMVRPGATPIAYSSTVEREPWMSDATVRVNTTLYGCCSSIEGEYSDPVARITPVGYTPKFEYVTPEADSVKVFQLAGSAFINFPVNRTELYPDYMSNPAELRKITGTIDSIKGDRDITITSLMIKGFASPEGSYSNNERLAKGRTATLRQYVEKLNDFPAGFIATDYMPEDWPGLRAYVASSSLPDRGAILDIIDSDMEPDAKDRKLRTDFPTSYAFLLREVYPSLRHSDYVITYSVRSYTSVEEILAVMRTAPQKLSAAEFYRAARSLENGSEEYNRVIETAVATHPDDAICNLNAANTAMARGDLDTARRNLDRAGQSAEAEYARGVLAALNADYTGALAYFRHASSLGYAPAAAALTQIEQLVSNPDGVVTLLTTK